MLEMLDGGGSMGRCRENMGSQKKTNLEGSGRQKWKKACNDQDCWEEVESKNSLGWYRMAKNEFGLETYIGSSQGWEAIRCRFRMRSGTTGLFADKKRCGLCGDDRCVDVQ